MGDGAARDSARGKLLTIFCLLPAVACAPPKLLRIRPQGGRAGSSLGGGAHDAPRKAPAGSPAEIPSLLSCSNHWSTLPASFPPAQLLHPGDATYEEQAVRGVRHQAVQLACGNVVSPMVVFWSFTKLGSLVPRAVAISNGLEAKVEKAAAALGQVNLRNGTLELSNLQTAAQGRFMCQAMYEEDGEIKVGYFYIELVVLVPVPRPSLQLSDPSPAEGAPVTMTCTVKEGTPPVGFAWHRHTSREGTVAVVEGASGRLNLTAANRTHLGWYTCTARNEVNSQTSDQMYLDVVYGPDEPVISVEPFVVAQHGFTANEQEEVVMTCLAPSNPPSHYVWFYNSSQVYSGQKYVIAKISRTQTGTYTCLAQNTHLNTRAQSTIVLTVYYLPEGKPSCTPEPAANFRDVALQCSWPGGFPPARLQWGSGPAPGWVAGEASALARPGLTAGPVSLACTDVPKLVAERAEVSLFEGGEARLACALQGPHLGSEVFWYNNRRQVVRPDTVRYRLQQAGAWFNLTVRDTEWLRDSGTYQCAAVNAVGNASLPIRLHVKKYPRPPNVTISKLTYTRQRTQVQLVWETQGSGNLTGFVVQRQEAKKPSLDPARLAARAWETVASDIEPDIRDHRVGGLDPAVVYAFRILAVNHRTTGHPSEVKTPAEPPFNAYPAVLGAAAAGMLVAAVASLLAFQYIVRNRDNNPRLHDLLFGMPGPDAQEHISTPEDAEMAAGAVDGMDVEPGGTSPTFPSAGEASAECHPEPPATAQEAPPAPDPTADDPPVNVTITVTATS
ncbi:V-set and immunoglobulin domain-containing protein 10-like 2 [Pelodiscus sinensis]|uniref:V-set and immunoglobulin domain-containing protein 10-like 2 n=1 Tax=Pelodiscus sinensis TaxID=13735 RepID=UPI003F6D073D